MQVIPDNTVFDDLRGVIRFVHGYGLICEKFDLAQRQEMVNKIYFQRCFRTTARNRSLKKTSTEPPPALAGGLWRRVWLTEKLKAGDFNFGNGQ